MGFFLFLSFSVIYIGYQFFSMNCMNLWMHTNCVYQKRSKLENLFWSGKKEVEWIGKGDEYVWNTCIILMHISSNWQQWWVCFWIRIHKYHVDNQLGYLDCLKLLLVMKEFELLLQLMELTIRWVVLSFNWCNKQYLCSCYFSIKNAHKLILPYLLG